jgi:ABC-type multidrug transport system fused ATPase/permease subunit
MSIRYTSRMLWKILPLKQKKLCINFCILTLLSGIFDTFSILTVIPLIRVILEPDVLRSTLFAFGINAQTSFYYLAAFFLLLLVVAVSALIKIIIIRASLQVSARLSYCVSALAFAYIIDKKYEDLISQPKGSLIATLSSKLNLASFFIAFVLQTISFSVLSVIIISTLFVLQPGPIALAGLILIICYLFITYFTRSLLSINSKNLSETLDKQLTNLKATFELLAEIKLHELEPHFKNSFNSIDYKLRCLGADNSFVATYPRYIMEAIGYMLLVGIALWQSWLGQTSDEILSTLSLLSIGIAKLLPYFQQIYNSITLARANADSAAEVLTLLAPSEP